MVSRLKETREAKGWTQIELSEKSGVSRATISAIEYNQTVCVKTATLTKLADALGKSVGALFF